MLGKNRFKCNECFQIQIWEKFDLNLINSFILEYKEKALKYQKSFQLKYKQELNLNFINDFKLKDKKELNLNFINEFKLKYKTIQILIPEIISNYYKRKASS